MSDEEEKHTDKDLDALLKIIREKDNLIVSLKEAATRRDKLNEQQIRMLAEDNSKKLRLIKSLNSEIKEIKAKLAQKEAELSLFKVTEGRLTSKITEFKTAFERYRAQVTNSLSQIKLSIQQELAKRDEYKNKLLDEIKDNYLKLEKQLQELDNYYKEIIADISKKQGLAKKYIRHALNDLQEALSLLDIAHAEFIQPTKILEDFSRIMDESDNLFKEFKELKGLPQGATLIKNIENVTVKLGSVPQIEGIFEEIHNITETTQRQMEENVKRELGSKAQTTEVDSESSEGGSATSDNRSQVMASPATGEKSGTGDNKSKIGLSQKLADANKGGNVDGKQKKVEQTSGKERFSEQGSGGEKKASITDDRVKSEEKSESEKNEDDIQEVIFKRGKNYAPFNWNEILTDIQLKRFQSFIQSCIKAEKEGNFLKALELYKTIREQPGISETIAGKLLDDHIEYLEDLIKRKYSINYRK